MSEGQKVPLQVMLTSPFSKHVSHEKECSSVVPLQDHYLTFSYLQLPFFTPPHASDYPASLSHSI